MLTLNIMNDPIVIYSPQKCGSTTVMRALESAGYLAHRANAKNILTLPWREAKIINLIRDPIDQGISLMFEEWLMTEGGAPNSANVIDDMNIFPAINWFQDCFEPLFGFNPIGDYNGSRDADSWMSGQHMYIRTDKLSCCLANGLKHFIKYEADFDVQHRARGVDRFGTLYREYYFSVRIDNKLLEAVYNSDYCKAFWTEEERHGASRRWILQ